MASKEGVKRTLILCVDRDNDLGVKTAIKTPVIGKEEMLKAATALAMKDPEEADANAMFEAVRLYERLRESADPNEEYEVATITGSEVGGIAADRKVAMELAKVREVFPADGVILVTDGYSDEDILPLIQSRIPVTSVRRVIVKHSKTIEETAALFSRYARMLIEDPRYSRMFLGVPGIIMLILAFLWFFKLLFYGWIAFLTVFGAILLVKGFKLGNLLKRFPPSGEFHIPPPSRNMGIFLYLAGGLTTLVGVYQGVYFLHSYVIPAHGKAMAAQWVLFAPRLLGWFFLRSSILVIAGLCIVILGKAVQWLFLRDSRFWHGVIGIIACAWFQRVLHEASLLLIDPSLPYTGLVTTIVAGTLLISGFMVFLIPVRRRYGAFFRERGRIEG